MNIWTKWANAINGTPSTFNRPQQRAQKKQLQEVSNPTVVAINTLFVKRSKVLQYYNPYIKVTDLIHFIDRTLGVKDGYILLERLQYCTIDNIYKVDCRHSHLITDYLKIHTKVDKLSTMVFYND